MIRNYLILFVALNVNVVRSLNPLPSIPESVLSQTNLTVFPWPIVTDFEGFGSSLAWWAKFAGSLPENQMNDFLSQVYNVSYSRTSLGLSIVRYNIGGSHASQSSRYGPYKLIETFWNGPSENDWDWSVDKEQRMVLSKAKQFGATKFEAFANSPPWWMTYSKDARGSHIGPIDNLNPKYFDAYADYLIRVVEKFQNEWGIPFTSISPFNEPNGLYWHTVFRNATQEGCVFLPATQSIFLKKFYPKLQKSGLIESCVPVAHEAYTLKAAFWDLRLGANYNWVDKVNVHGYGHERSIKDPLGHNKDRLKYRQTIIKKNPNNVKRFWMSETGGFGIGRQAMLRIAQTITYDLNIMGVQGWVYWQVLDTDPKWPLYDTPVPWASETFQPTLHGSGWGLLHFSRHIRPGHTIYAHSGIALGGCTICYVVSSNDQGTQLVVVVINMESTETSGFRLDLSQLITVNGKLEKLRTASSITAYQTVPDQDKWYIEINPDHSHANNQTRVSTSAFSYHDSAIEARFLPAFSLTTLVLS